MVEHALYGWQEIEVEIPIEYTKEEEMAAFPGSEGQTIVVEKNIPVDDYTWAMGTANLVGGMALINFVWMALIMFLSLR